MADTAALNGGTTTFKIDTGTDITVISKEVYKNLPQHPSLKPATAVLCSRGGRIRCVGEFTTTFLHKSVEYPARIFVAKGKYINCLLSWQISFQMGLVKMVEEITDHSVFGDMHGFYKILCSLVFFIENSILRKFCFAHELLIKEIDRMTAKDIDTPVT